MPYSYQKLIFCNFILFWDIQINEKLNKKWLHNLHFTLYIYIHLKKSIGMLCKNYPVIYTNKHAENKTLICWKRLALCCMLSVSLCAVATQISRDLSISQEGQSFSQNLQIGHLSADFLLRKRQQQVCIKVNTQSIDASAVFFPLFSQTSSSFSVFPHISCTGIGTSSSSVHWLDPELLLSERQRPDNPVQYTSLKLFPVMPISYYIYYR